MNNNLKTSFNNQLYNVDLKVLDYLYGPWESFEEFLEELKIDDFTNIPMGLTIGIKENGRVVDYWKSSQEQIKPVKKTSVGVLYEDVEKYSDASNMVDDVFTGCLIHISQEETIEDKTYHPGLYVITSDGLKSVSTNTKYGNFADEEKDDVEGVVSTSDVRNLINKLNGELSEKIDNIQNVLENVEDLDGKLNTIDSEISDLTSKDKKLEEDISKISKKVDDIDSKNIDKIKEDVESNLQSINTLQTSVTNNSGKIESLESSVKSNSDEIVEIKQDVNNLETQVDNLNKNINKISDIDGISEKVDGLIEKLENVEDLDGKLEEINSTLTQHGEDIDKLQESLESKGNEITKINSSVEDLNKQISYCEDSINARLSAVEDQHENDIETLNKKIQNISGSGGELSIDIITKDDIKTIPSDTNVYSASKVDDILSKITPADSESVIELKNEVENKIDKTDIVQKTGDSTDKVMSQKAVTDAINNITGGSLSPSSSTISTTYSELLSLVENGELIPGTEYRITDYECTTTQENTRSADHRFDIIVTADDVNVINENARAIQHDGDDYFVNNNLADWELKYTLNNNTDIHYWADNENGKGVVYYLKDEFNNSCSYDFKNIQYKRWKIESSTNENLDWMIGGYYAYDVDEDGDFYDLSTGGDNWMYTFDSSYTTKDNEYVCVDSSLDGMNLGVYNNTLGTSIIPTLSQEKGLPNVVLHGILILDNDLSNVYNVTTDGYFYSNTFKGLCNEFICGEDTHENTFIETDNVFVNEYFIGNVCVGCCNMIPTSNFESQYSYFGMGDYVDELTDGDYINKYFTFDNDGKLVICNIGQAITDIKSIKDTIGDTSDIKENETIISILSDLNDKVSKIDDKFDKTDIITTDDNVESKPSSDTNVYSASKVDSLLENIGNLLNNKVDKKEGKGLSSNDYTDGDKEIVGSISSVTSRVDKNEQDISNLSASIATNINKINSLSTRVDSNTDNITTNTTSIATLWKKADTHNGEIETLKTSVGSISETIGMDNKDDLGGSTIISTLSGHTTDISNIQESISGIYESLSTHTTDISSIQSSISSINTTLSALSDDIDWETLPNKIKVLEDIDETTISNINTRLDGIDSSITNITGEIGRLTTLESTTSEHTTSISTLSTAVTSNTESINSLTSTLNDISGVVTTNGQSITSLQDSVSTNTGNITDLTNRMLNVENISGKNTTDIKNLTSKVENNESDISNLKTNLGTVSELGTDTNVVEEIKTLKTNVETNTTNINKKFDTENVVGETGQNEDKVINQKVVTELYTGLNTRVIKNEGDITDLNTSKVNVSSIVGTSKTTEKIDNTTNIYSQNRVDEIVTDLNTSITTNFGLISGKVNISSIQGKTAEVIDVNTQILSKLATEDLINTKVDKVDGKGLSTNDYTDDHKTKVKKIDNIETTLNNISNKIGDTNVTTEITSLKNTIYGDGTDGSGLTTSKVNVSSIEGKSAKSEGESDEVIDVNTLILSKLATEDLIDEKIEDALSDYTPGTQSNIDIIKTGDTTISSDTNVYSAKKVDTLLDNKVDKVTGKGLSTNDYTTNDMNIVRGVQDKLDEKVNKVDGMGLYPDADKTKVAKIGDTSDLENGVTVMSKINGLISSIGSLSGDKVDELTTGLAGKVNISSIITPTGKDATKDTDIYSTEKTNSVISTYVTEHILQDTGTDTTKTMSQNAITDLLNNKVDKETGKGLSTNDYANTDKSKVDRIGEFPETWGINDTITSILDNKVDKDGDKVLSDKNYTESDQTAVSKIGAGVVNDGKSIIESLNNKVDKDGDKVLSTNDYTTEDKTAVGIISNKVDKDNDVIKNTDETIVTTEEGKVYSAKKTEDRISSVTEKMLTTDDIVNSGGNSETKVMSQSTITSLLSSKANTNDIPTILTSASGETDTNVYSANLTRSLLESKANSSDLDNKVDKKSGWDLSENNYATDDKTAVSKIGTGDVDGNKTIIESLNNKVNKETGKGLSDNNYTSDDKAAVGTISNKVDKNNDVTKTSDNRYTNLNDKVYSAGKVEELLGGKFDTTSIIKNTLGENEEELTPDDTNVYSAKKTQTLLSNKADNSSLNDKINVSALEIVTGEETKSSSTTILSKKAVESAISTATINMFDKGNVIDGSSDGLENKDKKVYSIKQTDTLFDTKLDKTSIINDEEYSNTDNTYSAQKVDSLLGDKTNKSDFETLNTTVGSHTTTIGSHSTDISNLKETISSHTTDIVNLSTSVKTNTDNISDLQTNVSTNTGSISTLWGSVNTNITSINTINTKIGTTDIGDGKTITGVLSTHSDDISTLSTTIGMESVSELGGSTIISKLTQHTTDISNKVDWTLDVIRQGGESTPTDDDKIYTGAKVNAVIAANIGALANLSVAEIQSAVSEIQKISNITEQIDGKFDKSKLIKTVLGDSEQPLTPGDDNVYTAKKVDTLLGSVSELGTNTTIVSEIKSLKTNDVKYTDIKSEYSSSVTDSNVYSAKYLNTQGVSTISDKFDKSNILTTTENESDDKVYSASLTKSLLSNKADRTDIPTDYVKTTDINSEFVTNSTDKVYSTQFINNILGENASSHFSETTIISELGNKFETSNIVTGTSTETESGDRGKVYSTLRMNSILTTKINTSDIVKSSENDNSDTKVYSTKKINTLLSDKVDKTQLNGYVSYNDIKGEYTVNAENNKDTYSVQYLNSLGVSTISNKVNKSDFDALSVTVSDKFDVSNIITTTSTGDSLIATDIKVYSASKVESLLTSKASTTEVNKKYNYNAIITSTETKDANTPIYSKDMVDSLLGTKLTSVNISLKDGETFDIETTKTYSSSQTDFLLSKKVDTLDFTTLSDTVGAISGDLNTLKNTVNNETNGLSTRVVSLESIVTGVDGVTGLVGSVSTNTNDISTLSDRVTTVEGVASGNTSLITNLTTRVGTNETNIGNLDTDKFDKVNIKSVKDENPSTDDYVYSTKMVNSLIKKVSDDVVDLSNNLNSEIQNRENADNLKVNISKIEIATTGEGTEATIETTILSKGAVEEKINTEKANRESADTQLSGRIDDIEEQITVINGTSGEGLGSKYNYGAIVKGGSETGDVNANTPVYSKNAVDELLTKEVDDRNTAILTAISTEVTDRNDAISTAKSELNTSIQQDISELSGRMTGVESVSNTNKTNIESLQTIVGDTSKKDSLSGKVNTLENIINNETTGLSAKVTKNTSDISTLNINLSREIQDRISGDNNLDAKIAQNTTDITNLGTRVGVTESDINSLKGRVSTTESDINSLKGRVGVNENSINNLSNDKFDKVNIKSAKDENITTNDYVYSTLVVDSFISNISGSVSTLDAKIDTEIQDRKDADDLKVNISSIKDIDSNGEIVGATKDTIILSESAVGGLIDNKISTLTTETINNKVGWGDIVLSTESEYESKNEKIYSAGKTEEVIWNIVLQEAGVRESEDDALDNKKLDKDSVINGEILNETDKTKSVYSIDKIDTLLSNKANSDVADGKYNYSAIVTPTGKNANADTEVYSKGKIDSMVGDTTTINLNNVTDLTTAVNTLNTNKFDNSRVTKLETESEDTIKVYSTGVIGDITTDLGGSTITSVVKNINDKYFDKNNIVKTTGDDISDATYTNSNESVYSAQKVNTLITNVVTNQVEWGDVDDTNTTTLVTTTSSIYSAIKTNALLDLKADKTDLDGYVEHEDIKSGFTSGSTSETYSTQFINNILGGGASTTFTGGTTIISELSNRVLTSNVVKLSNATINSDDEIYSANVVKSLLGDKVDKTTYDNKVLALEGSITTNSGSITSLNNAKFDKNKVVEYNGETDYTQNPVTSSNDNVYSVKFVDELLGTIRENVISIQNDNTNIKKSISDEINARQDADTDLTNSINAEKTNRENEDKKKVNLTQIQDWVGGEVKVGTSVTTILSESMVNKLITDEATARSGEITSKIATEITERDNAISTAISGEVTNRTTAISTAISTEVTNRDAAISDAISTEVTNRNTAISTAISNLNIGDKIDKNNLLNETGSESTTNVYSAKYVKDKLDTKVDKISGKGLSTYDYDNDAVTAVSKIGTGEITGGGDIISTINTLKAADYETVTNHTADITNLRNDVGTIPDDWKDVNNNKLNIVEKIDNIEGQISVLHTIDGQGLQSLANLATKHDTDIAKKVDKDNIDKLSNELFILPENHNDGEVLLKIYSTGKVDALLSNKADVNVADGKYNYSKISTTTSEGNSTADTIVYSAGKVDEIKVDYNDILKSESTGVTDKQTYSAKLINTLLSGKANTNVADGKYNYSKISTGTNEGNPTADTPVYSVIKVNELLGSKVNTTSLPDFDTFVKQGDIKGGYFNATDDKTTYSVKYLNTLGVSSISGKFDNSRVNKKGNETLTGVNVYSTGIIDDKITEINGSINEKLNISSVDVIESEKIEVDGDMVVPSTIRVMSVGKVGETIAASITKMFSTDNVVKSTTTGIVTSDEKVYSTSKVNSLLDTKANSTTLNTKVDLSQILVGTGEGTSATLTTSIYSKKAVDDKIGNVTLWNGVTNLTSAVTSLNTNKFDNSRVTKLATESESTVKVYSTGKVDDIKTTIESRISPIETSLASFVKYDDVLKTHNTNAGDSNVYSAKYLNTLGVSTIGSKFDRLNIITTSSINSSLFATDSKVYSALLVSSFLSTKADGDELDNYVLYTDIKSGFTSGSTSETYSTGFINTILGESASNVFKDGVTIISKLNSLGSSITTNTNNINLKFDSSNIITTTSTGNNLTATNDKVYSALVTSSFLNLKADKTTTDVLSDRITPIEGSLSKFVQYGNIKNVFSTGSTSETYSTGFVNGILGEDASTYFSGTDIITELGKKFETNNIIKSSQGTENSDTKVYSASKVNSLLSSKLSSNDISSYLSVNDIKTSYSTTGIDNKVYSVSYINGLVIKSTTSIPTTENSKVYSALVTENRISTVVSNATSKMFSTDNIVTGSATTTVTGTSTSVYSTERMNEILTTKVETSNVVTAISTPITGTSQIYCASVVKELYIPRSGIVISNSEGATYDNSRVYSTYKVENRISEAITAAASNKLNINDVVYGTSPIIESDVSKVYSVGRMNSILTTKVNTDDIVKGTNVTISTSTQIYNADVVNTLLSGKANSDVADGKYNYNAIVTASQSDTQSTSTPVYSKKKVDELLNVKVDVSSLPSFDTFVKYGDIKSTITTTGSTDKLTYSVGLLNSILGSDVATYFSTKTITTTISNIESKYFDKGNVISTTTNGYVNNDSKVYSASKTNQLLASKIDKYTDVVRVSTTESTNDTIKVYSTGKIGDIDTDLGGSTITSVVKTINSKYFDKGNIISASNTTTTASNYNVYSADKVEAIKTTLSTSIKANLDSITSLNANKVPVSSIEGTNTEKTAGITSSTKIYSKDKTDELLGTKITGTIVKTSTTANETSVYSVEKTNSLLGEKLTWGSNNITSTTNNSYKSNNDKLYTAGKVDELLSSKITGVIVTGTSTSPATGTSTGVYSTERMNAILSSKVTVESGKGLSTNDYADADKTKVSKIGTIPTDWGTNDTIISVLGNKVDKTNDVIKGTDSTIVTTENSKVYSAKKTEDRIISVVTGNVVSETTTTTETTNVDKVYSVGRMNSILTTKVNTSDIIKTGTDNTDNKVYSTKRTNELLETKIDKPLTTTPEDYVPTSNGTGGIEWKHIESKGMVEITWSELKSLRNAMNLIPGTFYRITDYTCTTSLDCTQSAGHQFDIIVVADGVNKLNENTRAIQHSTSDSDYFYSCNLSTWELKYCLDNDTNRFEWASSSGRGVIYYMKDEFGNECSYDFKSIQFKRWSITSTTMSELYTVLPMCGAYGMENVTLSEDDHMYFYTFSAYDDVNERMVDLSLSGMVNYNNMVGSWDNVFVLLPDGNGDDLSVNNNTFISGCNGNMLYVYVKCDNNTFNSNCKYNIITGYDNTLGNNCCYNVLYMSNSNIFEDGCNKNLLYFYTNYNKFGNNCESNTLMLCHTNTFENNCKSNTLVSNCSYNIFKNNCESNVLGSETGVNTKGCNNNTFGCGCKSNTLMSNCSYNIFKNNCESNIIAYGSYNVFGNCCCYNILGQHNYHITFGNNCSYNTFGSPTNDHPEESTYCVQNITFGGGCEYLDINCSVQSTSKYLQNVNISQGVCGTSSSKLTITIPNRGLAYETSVAKDSSGNLQIYNPADLAALLVGGYDAFFTKS